MCFIPHYPDGIPLFFGNSFPIPVFPFPVTPRIPSFRRLLAATIPFSSLSNTSLRSRQLGDGSGNSQPKKIQGLGIFLSLKIRFLVEKPSQDGNRVESLISAAD